MIPHYGQLTSGPASWQFCALACHPDGLIEARQVGLCRATGIDRTFLVRGATEFEARDPGQIISATPFTCLLDACAKLRSDDRI